MARAKPIPTTNGEAQAITPKLQLRRVALADLHHDPANARLHDERNLETIRASLKTFGQVEPLVVQKGTNKVIGGNGRLSALLAMGEQECDVVEVDLDNVSAVGLGIALNRTAELAEWDDAALASTLKALQDEAFNLGAVGYTDDEVQGLIDRLAGEIVDDPQGEWQGMPETEHEDLTAEFKVYVHIRNEEDLRAFERLLGQKVPRDRWAIWYPAVEIGHYKDKRYAAGEGDESEVSGLYSNEGTMAEAVDDSVINADRSSLQGSRRAAGV
jgi:hypothetical protein